VVAPCPPVRRYHDFGEKKASAAFPLYARIRSASPHSDQGSVENRILLLSRRASRL
jgi:hypothetical protein